MKITEQKVECLNGDCIFTGVVSDCESGEEGDLVCPVCLANCKVITKEAKS